MTDHVCPRCGAGHSSRPDPDYEDAAPSAEPRCLDGGQFCFDPPRCAANGKCARRTSAVAPSAEPCPIHDSDISGRGACTCFDVTAPSAGAGDVDELLLDLEEAEGYVSENPNVHSLVRLCKKAASALARLRTERDKLRDDQLRKVATIVRLRTESEQLTRERDCYKAEAKAAYGQDLERALIERDKLREELAQVTEAHRSMVTTGLMLKAERDAAVARAEAAIGELRNIAEAKRYDRLYFDNDSVFVDWAQSRCRAAIDAAREGSADKGSGG